MSNRRRFLLGSASLLAAWPARAAEGAPVIADMHSHLGMFARNRDVHLRDEMQRNGVGLIAWAIVDDSPWIRSTPRRMEQSGQPRAGELWQWFQRAAGVADARLAAWGLPKALTAADVDAAMAGTPHVVMACEAANFLEGDASRLQQAYARGLRHIQLVHYIASPLGDLQTAAPRHGGELPQATRAVIAECQRLGILVDLAHCAPALVEGALDASAAPMIWSHSWIRPGGGRWQEPGNLARSLSPEQARKIAAHGGVIGLWSVRSRDRSYPLSDVASYADEILRMASIVGPQAVGLGTDMDGAGPNPILSGYADARQVVDRLAALRVDDRTLRDLCGGNYARVLKQVLKA